MMRRRVQVAHPVELASGSPHSILPPRMVANACGMPPPFHAARLAVTIKYFQINRTSLHIQQINIMGIVAFIAIVVVVMVVVVLACVGIAAYRKRR